MTNKYNYREAVTADVLEYIEENFTEEEIAEELKDRDVFAEELNDTLWTEDSVTGNASGSYTLSTWKAEEYLMHNLDLLAEAVEEFGGGVDILKSGAEACDVTIRCYLLGECVAEAIDWLEGRAE